MSINMGQEKYAKAAAKITYDADQDCISVSGSMLIDAYQTMADAAGTVNENTQFLTFSADATGSRVITMPRAVPGRFFKAIWIVEQATSDRVFTCAGGDDFIGQIQCSVQGDDGGDGDVLSVTDGSVAITCVDDVNIGSYIDFYCGVEGQWIVMGHLTYDAVGAIPTIA